MANIRDIKKRIKGAKQTLKITGALKLVSGSMLAKVNTRVRQARPYLQELEGLMKIVPASVFDYSHKYLQSAGGGNQTLLLVISSERGLCGSYNSILVRKVKEYIADNQQFDFKMYGIGRKAVEVLEREVSLVKRFTFEKAEPNYLEIESIANELAEVFVKGEVGKILVAYNAFESALKFTPTIVQLLPYTSFEEERAEILKKELPTNYIYDVSPAEILDVLIPEIYISRLFSYQLSALTAEYSARMWAMENASKNCGEVIKKLTLKMNKMRQGSITKELIEIVSGAEAMHSRS